VEDNKLQIYNFAKQNNLCVISTCVENIPESAVVDYVISENLEIFFNSYIASRKYKNLLINPKVSIVIGFGEALKTLQCAGSAEMLEGHDESAVINKYADTLLFSRRWKNKEMRYFRVKLSWVRLSDFSDFPPTQVELNLEDF